MTQMIALAFAKVYLNNRLKDLKLIFFEKKKAWTRKIYDGKQHSVWSRG